MDTEHYKQKLEEELKVVEKELGELSHEDIDETATEKDELADRMEEHGEAVAEKEALAARKMEIEAALARIDIGTYGQCTVCHQPIEKERLDANPAAATCVAHAK